AGLETADAALDAGLEALAAIEGMDDAAAKRVIEVLESYYAETEVPDPGAKAPSPSDTPAASGSEPNSADRESEEERG
ncbi:MAG: hypothetical protein PHI18_05775, partial [bacterium]|nr:hypothetical protein [bacterium]